MLFETAIQALLLTIDFYVKRYQTYDVSLLLLAFLVAGTSHAKPSHQVLAKPKPGAEADKQMLKTLLDDAVRKTEDPQLAPEERTKQYLLMIGVLYILSYTDGNRYKNMLGLTLFNYPAAFRDPYFGLSLKIFKKIPGVKAKLRAAYSAYSIRDFDLAREIFEDIQSDLSKVKLTEVEKSIQKKLSKELYKSEIG